MKLRALQKASDRIECIQKKLPRIEEDEKVKRHDWKVYKLLMIGKYNKKVGIIPVTMLEKV